MNSTEHISISLALSHTDRHEAMAYIEATMIKSFGCQPPPTKGLICVAHIAEKMVGSLVLQASTKNHPFSVEKQYAFDTSNTPFPFIRDEIIQASRWTAIRPQVSYDILQYSLGLAYQLGKRYMLIEAKPYSVQRLQELGFDCRKIEGAALLTEEILKIVGENGMQYYRTEPLPTLYMAEIILADLEH